MFLGEYNPNLTEGSRIALPKKMREQIRGDTVVLSRGFEKCIFVYDAEDWTRETGKQIEASITEKNTRNLRRYMFASATESGIDGQGRLVIPGNLKDYADISKSLAVIGAGDHIEIWDKTVWEEHLEKISTELAE